MKKKSLLKILVSSLVVSSVVVLLYPDWVTIPMGLWLGVFLPGTLLLLAIKKKVELNWLSAVYVVGLGVFSLMINTLLGNWLLLAVGVSRPLTHIPLLLSIVTVDSIMFISYTSWENKSLTHNGGKLNTIERYFVLLSSSLLFVFIIGATILNNGGSNFVSIGGYIEAVVFLGTMTVLLGRIRNGVLVYILWSVGLGIFLSGWLRSNFVSGPDISAEYQIFNLIRSNGYWNISLYRQAYNACLSVSLLPLALSLLTKISGALVFKLVIPFLYSFLIPIVYLIAERFLKKSGGAIAAMFFISQPAFFAWWWIPIRQEIAFLFFGLIVLVMATTLYKHKSQTMLFLIFTLGMIVSHYSTSYVALVFFMVLYPAFLLTKRFRKSLDKPAFLPSPVIILLTLLVIFGWYSQITYGFSSFEQFVVKDFKNISGIFNQENQAQGQTVFDQLNIFSKAGNSGINLTTYETGVSDKAIMKFGKQNLYPPPSDSKIQSVSLYTSNSLAATFITVRKSVIVIGKLLIMGSTVVLFCYTIRRKQLISYAILCIAALLLLLFVIAVPFLSLSYDLVRTFQQILIVLGGVLGLAYTLKRQKWILFLTSGFILVYFILVSNMIFVLLAPGNAPAALANGGSQYDYYYVDNHDYHAASWLAKNAQSTTIVGDTMSQYKIRLTASIKTSSSMQIGVFTSSIPRNSYVFADSSNVSTGAAFDSQRGGILTYRFPFVFLNNNKNMVYSNGKSNIYE